MKSPFGRCALLVILAVVALTGPASAQTRDDVAVALDAIPASDRIVAEFQFPYLAHSPMEPLNTTIRFDGDKAEYRATKIEYAVHCPPRTFAPGTYTWRYRGKDKNVQYTNWSQSRRGSPLGEVMISTVSPFCSS